MLILSRRLNETIMIGDDVQIKLVMIGHKRALIGISAPKHVQVYRQEIFDQRKLSCDQERTNVYRIANQR